MSKLALYNRPTVLFDPNNQLHRRYFTAFLVSGTWQTCPVRFAVEEDHGNLIGHIQRKMLLWYTEQEKKGKLSVAKMPRGRKSLGLTGSGFEITIDT
jgi:hypothetical protein